MNADSREEWRQENGDQLLIGHRDEPNQILYRESAALEPGARVYSCLPSGHTESRWANVETREELQRAL